MPNMVEIKLGVDILYGMINLKCTLRNSAATRGHRLNDDTNTAKLRFGHELPSLILSFESLD